MAYAMTKQGSLDNCVTYEFMCDTVEDMNAIEDRYRTIGTVAIVLQGNSGLEVYIASSDKQWNSFSGAGAGSAGAGLSIHICGQSEVENGLPNVSEPDEATIYLVPASDSSSGNLYDEYVYVAEAWEKFGSGGVSNDLPITYEKAIILELEDVMNIDTRESSSEEVNAAIKDITIDITQFDDYRPTSGVLEVGQNKYDIDIRYRDMSQAQGFFYINGFSKEREARFVISHDITNNTTELIVTDSNNTLNETYPVRIQFGHTILYVDNTQERIITESSPEFTGSISMGRASNTTIGEYSVAEGQDVEASGGYSHAEGYNTIASGWYSHTEGENTQASGSSSHAEGVHAQASSRGSHAEGVDTNAEGQYSHAEGSYTTAHGTYSHAEGQNTEAYGNATHSAGKYTIARGEASTVLGAYNIADQYLNVPVWQMNTQYNLGDIVRFDSHAQSTDDAQDRYICILAHTSESSEPYGLSSNYWRSDGRMKYIEIVGNGADDDNRSNARALDWDGNEYLMGDVYVGCNADSTGGAKVATEAYVNARIPTPPTTDGTYTLQVTVSNGEATYSWI